MGSRSADKIKFTSFDQLFGEPQKEGTDERRIVEVPLSELHPFRNHPFRVMDDDKMLETVESIRRYGVLVPGIVRNDSNGGYELISGHRRKRGCELAERKTMPVIIRELSDDEATIIMVDSNIQREDILPSEKAWAYRMKLEALKHQGSKGEKHTASLVGEKAGESGRTVWRFIRLTYLEKELLDAVDEKRCSLVVGENLSYLTVEEQRWVCQIIGRAPNLLSGSQAELLKEESGQGILTKERVASIVAGASKNDGLEKRLKISIPAKRIQEYFPPEYTKEQVESIIFELLDNWKKQQIK